METGAEINMYRETGFLSKRKAEAIRDLEGAEKRVLISVTSPNTRGCKPAVLHDPSWSKVLRMEFHDIDPQFHSELNADFELVFFNEKHAIEIMKFLKEHEDAHEVAVVHCEAGISRSAAISKFIAYVYGLEFPETYSVYNRHIFTTLVRSFNRSLYGAGPLRTDELPGQRSDQTT